MFWTALYQVQWVDDVLTRQESLKLEGGIQITYPIYPKETQACSLIVLWELAQYSTIEKTKQSWGSGVDFFSPQ